eukprot:2861490-Pleurochrysis_carterae.AAC.1
MGLHHTLDCHASGRSCVVGLACDDANEFAAAPGALLAQVVAGGNVINSFEHGFHQLTIDVDGSVRVVDCDEPSAALLDLARVWAAAGREEVARLKVGSIGEGE